MSAQAIEGWLTDAYDYERPRRGQIREGVILRVEKRGIVIDVGLKREGIVPPKDVERLGEEASSRLVPGQEVMRALCGQRIERATSFSLCTVRGWSKTGQERNK